jgi:hypothetical protein
MDAPRRDQTSGLGVTGTGIGGTGRCLMGVLVIGGRAGEVHDVVIFNGACGDTTLAAAEGVPNGK